MLHDQEDTTLILALVDEILLHCQFWIFGYFDVAVLSYVVTTSHPWLLKFKLVKIQQNLKLVSLVSLQVPHFNPHVQLVTTARDSADEEHSHHCRKLYGTALHDFKQPT